MVSTEEEALELSIRVELCTASESCRRHTLLCGVFLASLRRGYAGLLRSFADASCAQQSLLLLFSAEASPILAAAMPLPTCF